MGLALKILVPFLKVVEWFLIAVTSYWRKNNKINRITNPISDKLLEISATDLAAKIRNREITSEELCKAYIRRIKEVNPLLNAIVEERFEEALKDARNVDAYLRISPLDLQELEKIKPLLGVPLTVKESCSVAGMSLCGGTLGRLGIKADSDGETVSKLRTRGAIPLLVSNTPEICLSFEARNFVTGPTNNPYNLARSSGGSSGGEGALLGAGASVIGLGSDVAGSIRIPALFNGVFGHKPTPRVSSIKGHFPNAADEAFADYLVIGPLARYAKDLKLMMKVMANDKNQLNLDEKVDLRSLRIFSVEKLPGSPLLCDPPDEITDVLGKSVRYLVDKCGCTKIDKHFDELEDACEIGGGKIFALDDIPNLLKGENLAVELCKSLVGHSKYTFNLLFFYAIQVIFNNIIINPKHLEERHSALKRAILSTLGDNGVLLMPTMPNTAFHHNLSATSVYSVTYAMIWSCLGVPATHVPCGLDKEGLPIGIQVIAAPNQDRLCLAVAEELEKLFGGWTPPYYS